MKNTEIRIAMLKNNVKQFEVAEMLGIHETTLCRWLRTEFDEERKETVANAIREIIARRG